MPGALLAHDRQDGAGDVHRADQARGDLPVHLLGRELLEEARVEAGGVVDEHVDAAEALDSGLDRRLGVLRAGDVEPDDEQVVRVADGLGDGVGVAAGGHDVVAGGERGLGDVDAHSAAGAGDEPGLLLGGHGVQQSADPEKVGVPVERGTGRVPQARVAGSTLAFVETKKEIREFLTSRRARVTPEQAGLPTYGARRVPGLRREEVAVLAGVSVPYYTRLERGDMSGASEGVLEALARALQLDDAERAHLFDLARAAQPAGARPRRRQAKPRIRPEIQWTLDAITGAAAYVGNDRLDILATNQLGRALFSELYAAPARPANHARFVFLDPRAEAFYADWDRAARETAAILRSAAGRDPYDRDLSDLVGELATQSEAFRTHWAAHNVRFHATAVKHFHHPVVGELSLSFNRLDIAADHGLTLFTYAAEPGSRSEEALNLLGSWAATVDLAESARTTDQS